MKHEGIPTFMTKPPYLTLIFGHKLSKLSIGDVNFISTLLCWFVPLTKFNTSLTENLLWNGWSIFTGWIYWAMIG